MTQFALFVFLPDAWRMLLLRDAKGRILLLKKRPKRLLSNTAF